MYLRKYVCVWPGRQQRDLVCMMYVCMYVFVCVCVWPGRQRRASPWGQRRPCHTRTRARHPRTPWCRWCLECVCVYIYYTLVQITCYNVIHTQPHTCNQQYTHTCIQHTRVHICSHIHACNDTHIYTHIQHTQLLHIYENLSTFKKLLTYMCISNLHTL